MGIEKIIYNLMNRKPKFYVVEASVVEETTK